MYSEDFINSYLYTRHEDVCDIEEDDQMDIQSCDCCLEDTDCFVMHRDFIICNECIASAETENMNLDDIVDNLIKNQTKC